MVLGQVRFSTILKMGTYIPDIQETFRRLNLSRFQPEQTQRFTLGPSVSTASELRWVFSNREETEAVILSNDYFVYQVSEYDIFETFLGRLMPLLEVVGKCVEPDFVSQTGLRYVDLIRAEVGMRLSDYLVPELRGLSLEALEGEAMNHEFMMQVKTGVGVLFVRSFENRGEQFLPPDLETKHLKFKCQTTTDEDFRVLEFDHISKANFGFEPERIERLFGDLHRSTDVAFRKSVTPEALTRWGKD